MAECIVRQEENAVLIVLGIADMQRDGPTPRQGYSARW
jgi:hypothetical protein